ncbi:MAG: hypothetical protein M1817_001322 [Caeruleum heppii]|nr:MAG: hypothetical protein M1817_001322 [Caeruleum heppii]
MSLLQNEDYTIYLLRTSYLSTIKDGVGERLISVSPAVFNTPGFRAAGFQPNPADLKRTYSPPIPTTTTIASDYFQAPPLSAGLAPPPGFGEDEDAEGGMVTGVGGSGDTVGPGLTARRRRRREILEEEDSSDLSDESDEDGTDGTQRAAQQIKFAKMPVRGRSGSSPLRSSVARDSPSVLVTSPSRRSGEGPGARLRRGSLGAVEAIKQRARRDTTTSSDMSSENDSLDAAAMASSNFRRLQLSHAQAQANAERASRALAEKVQTPSQQRQNTKDSTDLEDEEDEGGGDGVEEEDSAEDSDAGTALSSDFAETAGSPSLLQGVVADPLTSSPLPEVPSPGTTPSLRNNHLRGNLAPRQAKGAAPSVLQALPPPRPISMIQPVSALSLAINARRTKAASPFERFATFSGKGDPNPLALKIYAPFSEKPTTPFEMLIRRSIREDGSGERKVTVVDAIGLSLWRYAEDNLVPPLTGERMTVNRWTLRMVEDEEVDFDFPALERTKPLVDFTSNNNRAARARSTTRAFDEFALVEATPEQFRENERLTPNVTPPVTKITSSLAPSTTMEEETDVTPQPSPGSKLTNAIKPIVRHNPVLGPTLNQSGPPSQTPRADAPTLPTNHATPRTGPSKILKIHYTSPEGYQQVVALDIQTDTYMAEVMSIVCKKRNLEQTHHVFKIPHTAVVVPLDRTVEALGPRSDVELVRRRFGNDGGFLGAGSLEGGGSSTPPNAPLIIHDGIVKKMGKGGKRAVGFERLGATSELSSSKPDLLSHLPSFYGPSTTSSSTTNATASALASTTVSFPTVQIPYKKRFTVWRKQPMAFMPTHERTLLIDTECLYILPAASSSSTSSSSPVRFDDGASSASSPQHIYTLPSSGKITRIPYTSIVGCRVSRKHPGGFRVVVYREGREGSTYFGGGAAGFGGTAGGGGGGGAGGYRDHLGGGGGGLGAGGGAGKRYDFEADSRETARVIVAEVERGVGRVGMPFGGDEG